MTDTPPTPDGNHDVNIDSNMDMIIPGLYLGNAFAQRSESRLRSFGITHILSITPYSFPLDGLLVRKSIPVDDYPDEDLMAHFSDTNKYIENAITAGGVLVHCQQGVSRSATFVAAYLMKTWSFSHQEAITFVKGRRTIAKPNAGFVRQLEIYGLSGWDLGSEEGQRLYGEWRKGRDAAHAAGLKGLSAAYQEVLASKSRKS